MEKIMKHNNNSFLKLLPKAVSFQNTPFSPGRDHHKAHAYKGFSGPINFAVLPDEARQKSKIGGYGSQEPTSPKVSCMGQIKCKHKKMSKTTKPTEEVKKNGSVLRRFFSMRPQKPDNTKTSNVPQVKSHGKVRKGATQENNFTRKATGMPSLGQMKKFTSGRETLGNFDWTAQIAPIDNDRDCFSDDERRRRDSDDEDEDEDDDGDEKENEVIIPFSAPILLGGGRNGGENLKVEPRKEVNLWKRRTMNPPPPLTLKSKFKVR